jgi:hypothetical protein
MTWWYVADKVLICLLFGLWLVSFVIRELLVFRLPCKRGDPEKAFRDLELVWHGGNEYPIIYHGCTPANLC